MKQSGTTGRTKAIGYLAVVVSVAVLLLTAMMLLPHELRLRYQAASGQDAQKVAWIYERTHLDPRPIDIAFFGSSHTMASVHGEMIEQWIEAQGLESVNVANLATPWHGRNLHYVLLKETLRSHRPDLIVIEVRETEGRLGHPLFVHLADSGDVIKAFGTGYDKMFLDLARLPQRQLQLFMQTQTASPGNDQLPVDYKPHWLEAHDVVLEPNFLDEQSANLLKQKRWHVLPDKLHGLEFRLPIVYVQRIAKLAQEHGIPIVFLYLPFYGAPELPVEQDLYEQLGELWIPPREILDNPLLWSDVTHQNLDGSVRMAPWIAEKLARFSAARAEPDTGR